MVKKRKGAAPKIPDGVLEAMFVCALDILSELIDRGSVTTTPEGSVTVVNRRLALHHLLKILPALNAECHRLAMHNVRYALCMWYDHALLCTAPNFCFDGLPSVFDVWTAEAALTFTGARVAKMSVSNINTELRSAATKLDTLQKGGAEWASLCQALDEPSNATVRQMQQCRVPPRVRMFVMRMVSVQKAVREHNATDGNAAAEAGADGVRFARCQNRACRRTFLYDAELGVDHTHGITLPSSYWGAYTRGLETAAQDMKYPNQRFCCHACYNGHERAISNMVSEIDDILFAHTPDVSDEWSPQKEMGLVQRRNGELKGAFKRARSYAKAQNIVKLRGVSDWYSDPILLRASVATMDTGLVYAATLLSRCAALKKKYSELPGSHQDWRDNTWSDAILRIKELFVATVDRRAFGSLVPSESNGFLGALKSRPSVVFG